MAVSFEETRVFEGRTFYAMECKGFDGETNGLELYEYYAEPFSYALAYLYEGKLVIDDHSWTGAHASIPLEGRVWFEEIAGNLLGVKQ